jgi:transcription elongation factor Elf1
MDEPSKKPNCPRCSCETFIESGITYEQAGKDSKDDMRVIICEKCGAVIGIPTRPIFDLFSQVGEKLNGIIPRLR